MKTKKLLGVLGLVNAYKCRPTTLFNIQDAYTAFCFDEACAYVIAKIEEGETPTFREKYKSFTDLYKQYK